MGNWKIENCSCVPSRDRDPAHNSKQTTNYALFHGSGTKTLFSGETCVSGTLYKTTLFEIYSKDSLLNGVLSVHQHFIDQKIFIVPNDHNIVIRGRCPTFREDHTSRHSLYYSGIRQRKRPLPLVGRRKTLGKRLLNSNFPISN